MSSFLNTLRNPRQGQAHIRNPEEKEADVVTPPFKLEQERTVFLARQGGFKSKICAFGSQPLNLLQQQPESGL